MKHRFNWQIILGIFLIVVSIIFYTIHYLIFRDAHHVFIFLLGDIAFVPIEVLLVTLILHRLLTSREKRAFLNKLNMVIGTFFSEVGTPLLRLLLLFDPASSEYLHLLEFTQNSEYQDLMGAKRRLSSMTYHVNLSGKRLDALKTFLISQKDFLLRLLENPNLLEHESFTHLLLAVFHLTEELSHREDLSSLSPPDKAHLTGDIARAYGSLVLEWVDYMAHLRTEFPYLYSLALRTNPFNAQVTVEFS